MAVVESKNMIHQKSDTNVVPQLARRDIQLGCASYFQNLYKILHVIGRSKHSSGRVAELVMALG